MVQGKLLKRRITRRQVLKGAALLGISAGTNFSFLRRPAEAAGVDIGVIYPTSGALARFGQACVNANAKMAS